MRWCYKTVHFDLKKEGFLGNAFLDEAEVEQSLNEYGQSSWELVSIVETQDGLIAFFKQPLEPVVKSRTPHPVEEYEVSGDVVVELAAGEKESSGDEKFDKKQQPDNDIDPYTIRIE